MANESLIPEQQILEGAKILSHYLEPLGFIFEFKGSGRTSGGDAAYGNFTKSNGLMGKTLTLEFHFRWSLGLVGYIVDGQRLSHEEYIDLLGKHGQNKYPNSSADHPQTSFRCLLWDLQNLLTDFTEDNAGIFRQQTHKIKQQQEAEHKAYNKRITSNDKYLLALAKEAFKQGDYRQVSQIKKQLKYPAELSPSEKKIFEMSEKRK